MHNDIIICDLCSILEDLTVKKITLGIALIIAMTALAGCGNKTESDETDVGTEPSDAALSAPSVTSDTGITGTSALTADFGLTQDEQLSIFFDNKDVWFVPDGFFYYAITDINNDSRLELIASACEGSGFYSTTYWYEVSADGSSVVEIPMEGAVSNDDLTQPDIVETDLEIRYDSEGNPYLLGCDTARSGFSYASFWYYTLVFKTGEDGNNYFDTALVGYQTFEVTDEGEEINTYCQADGTSITEAQFDELIASYGPVNTSLVMDWGETAEVANFQNAQDLAGIMAVVAEV